MATIPQPMPDQNAAQGSPGAPQPQQGGQQGQSTGGGPASPLQMLLVQWFRVSKEIAQHHPLTAPGMPRGPRGPSGACNTTAAAASITASVLNH